MAGFSFGGQLNTEPIWAAQMHDKRLVKGVHHFDWLRSKLAHRHFASALKAAHTANLYFLSGLFERPSSLLYAPGP